VSTSEPAPTSEDLAKGAEVVEAGTTAAQNEPDKTKRRGAAKEAITDSAESKGWKLSAADAEMLAGMVVAQLADLPDRTADKIAERGGFEHLPEPLSVPTAPTGTGALPAQPAATPQDERPTQEARGMGAFARHFRSGK
jgi:hypothetical protein